MIIINAPFKIGDYIDSGSFSGTVTDMDLICVTLVTPDNRTSLSQTSWSGKPIVNYSSMDKRRVDMTISRAYGRIFHGSRVDQQKLATYPEVLPNPAPTIESPNWGIAR
jgi:small conductance mechanosensitive channel